MVSVPTLTQLMIELNTLEIN